METTPFAPIARPRAAAANFLTTGQRGRAVLAEAVAVAFDIRGDAAARRAHDLGGSALLLLR